MYEREINKRRTVAKSEENQNGMIITPEMGDKIMIQVYYKRARAILITFALRSRSVASNHQCRSRT